MINDSDVVLSWFGLTPSLCFPHWKSRQVSANIMPVPQAASRETHDHLLPLWSASVTKTSTQ